tara:strand:- start:392 stop:664 length:273 start_codon:yes stop_codon:yes gene_type:complete
MINEDLTKQVIPTESELKEIIVNYVGNNLNPEDDEITVEQIVEVFSSEFPEFLLAVAEENWINGYTQALNDVQYVKNNNESNKIHKNQKK